VSRVATPPILEIRDLAVRRDGHQLLSEVSLDVRSGVLHFLVGPNGAGKSTLLSAILGLVEFTGTIRLHARGQGRIGYAPQQFAVDRTVPLSVGDFLALGRQRRPVCLGVTRTTRVRSEEILSRVGLPGFASRPLAALSGGELRRVLLANALDPVPELLLLDEPGSGLDEMATGRLEEILLELQRSAGVTVLMVSHDLDLARRIGDSVTILDRGLVRTGSPGKVLVGNLAGSLGADRGGERS
jgi:zinc transport system ATP-binding protein